MVLVKSLVDEVTVPTARTVRLHCCGVQLRPRWPWQPPCGCHQIGQSPHWSHGRNARSVPTYFCLREHKDTPDEAREKGRARVGRGTRASAYRPHSIRQARTVECGPPTIFINSHAHLTPCAHQPPPAFPHRTPPAFPHRTLPARSPARPPAYRAHAGIRRTRGPGTGTGRPAHLRSS